jgi:arylsulfatase A-like enzyme
MPPRPNILFIFSDQQHWQAVGIEDATFRTPHLDRLAGGGTVFRHAFCTTPQCSPSRSSILTGLYPTATGVLGNVGAAGGEPLRMPTIAPTLQAAGYRTAYYGKWHLGKEPVATAGWDDEFGVASKETTDDAEVTRRACRFLRRAAGGDQPFALFLSYNNPHDIYRFRGEAP